MLSYLFDVKKRILHYVDIASKCAVFLFWNPALMLPLLACVYQLVYLIVNSHLRYDQLVKRGAPTPAIKLLDEILHRW